jgi:uncharacterized protein (DUF1501 family)
MKRRDFLALAGVGSACLLAPSWLRAAVKPAWNRVLVLVELQGGNDGLNTVIPYRDPRYYALRPRLAIARDSALALTEQLGVNPALEALMPAWRAHELAVVLGVGYPQPNRSHFRSIEIWETASDADETLQQGWLAQLFARTPPPQDFAAHGVVLGGSAGPLAGDAAHIALHDTERFVQQAQCLRQAPVTTRNAALDHLLRVQQETQRAATTLEQRLAAAPALDAAFAQNPLGRQFATAARLIAARVPVATIKITHGGFDTHINQRGAHDRLLGELAAGLGAFRNTLIKHNRWSDVLVLTYSEFGRRAAENGSGGTDHGTAAPQFAIGGRVRGGLYGEQPSLTQLADGDLVHNVDFRQLYATAARRFLGLTPGFADAAYAPLDFIA